MHRPFFFTVLASIAPFLLGLALGRRPMKVK
jgi:hypothetical protein